MKIIPIHPATCRGRGLLEIELLNLEQIGETAKKLSEDFKNNTTIIEWNKIIGLRNIISHEYEGVDLTLIYNIARINIPDLLKKVLIIKTL